MAKPTNRQSGFGLVAVIAILLIVGAVAGVGYMVVKNRIASNKADASATAATPTVTDPKPTPAEGASLNIKEWGIAIPLPDSLKDAYYVVSTSTSDANGSPNTIWLGVKSIEECPAEGANKGGKALATIIRTGIEDTEPVSGKRYTETYPDGITIGNYFYGYNTWSEDNDCTTAENFKKIDDGFRPAIKKAKAIDAESANN